MKTDDVRHGSVAGYIAHGIANTPRCDPCRLAAREYSRQRIVRRYIARGALTTDGTGTRRRLRALIAIGWTLAELDTLLDRKRSYCSRLVADTGPVLLTTRAEVAKLYDRLSMSPRVGWLGDRQRRHAASLGWQPPLAWDDIDDPDESPGDFEDITCEKAIDPVVVERVLSGRAAESTTNDERAEIVRRWRASGRPVNELARLTGWKVQRYGRGDAA